MAAGIISVFSTVLKGGKSLSNRPRNRTSPRRRSLTPVGGGSRAQRVDGGAGTDPASAAGDGVRPASFPLNQPQLIPASVVSGSRKGSNEPASFRQPVKPGPGQCTSPSADAGATSSSSSDMTGPGTPLHARRLERDRVPWPSTSGEAVAAALPHGPREVPSPAYPDAAEGRARGVPKAPGCGRPRSSGRVEAVPDTPPAIGTSRSALTGQTLRPPAPGAVPSAATPSRPEASPAQHAAAHGPEGFQQSAMKRAASPPRRDLCSPNRT